MTGIFNNTGDRGHENGSDVRVAEDGRQRVIEFPNAGQGLMMVDGALISFAGEIQTKNSDTWQAPDTWVNDNGTWKLAGAAYYRQSGIWKRIL